MKYIYLFFAIGATVVFGIVTYSGVTASHFGADFMTHFKLGLLTVVLTLFVHALVFIYFISSHKAIKDALNEREDMDSESFVQRTRQLKMETMPWATLGMLMVIAATLLGGAADVGQLPDWTHWSFSIVTIAVNLYLFWFEYGKMVENVDLIHEVDAALVKYEEAKESGNRS